MWTVPKIWENGTCVIIGGGPSIIKQFDIPDPIVQSVYHGKLSPSAYSPYLEPLHAEHVIAVNMAYKLGDWVDMMFFGDNGFWDTYKKELQTFNRLIVTCAVGHISNNVKQLERIYPHKKHENLGITTDPTKVCWNNNSGSAAINLAVHFGVKRIILLGFDMSLDGGNNQHWHKYYTTPIKKVPEVMMRHMTGFPNMAKDLKRLGVEVINANPESKIECFPKMNYKDIR